jgi:hypothetical protein
MSWFSRLLRRQAEPPKRVRICVECGMPLDAHKDWCSILRTRIAIEQRRAAAVVDE